MIFFDMLITWPVLKFLSIIPLLTLVKNIRTLANSFSLNACSSVIIPLFDPARL